MSEIPDNDWWRSKQDAVKAAYFDIDGQFGAVRGVHNPLHRWNGFATPWFPMESVERIKAATDCAEQRLTIDRSHTPPQVWLWNKEYADEYDDPRGSKEMSVVVDGVTVYDIGNGGWCWDEVTENGEYV